MHYNMREPTRDSIMQAGFGLPLSATVPCPVLSPKLNYFVNRKCIETITCAM